MEQSAGNTNEDSGGNFRPKISKQSIAKALLNKNANVAFETSEARGAVGHQILSDSNDREKQSSVEPCSKVVEPQDVVQERIKINQEMNINRPKESKGHRTSEKRHI